MRIFSVDNVLEPFDDYDGDGFSNLQEFQNYTNPKEYSLELVTGWNLISISRVPEDHSVQAIFNGVDISPIVWGWQEGLFKSVNELHSLYGYWVYLQGPGVNVPIVIP